MDNQKIGQDTDLLVPPDEALDEHRRDNNGVDSPAQAVCGDHAIYGDSVRLPMYSFDTSLGGGRVADATRQLAKRSDVPKSW